MEQVGYGRDTELCLVVLKFSSTSCTCFGHSPEDALRECVFKLLVGRQRFYLWRDCDLPVHTYNPTVPAFR